METNASPSFYLTTINEKIFFGYSTGMIIFIVLGVGILLSKQYSMCVLVLK